jgi:hypothetical protein
MGTPKHRCKPDGLRHALMRFALSSLVCGATALASTPPPTADESISQSNASWRATSKPSSGMNMGNLKIKFEETNLAQVMRATGLGNIEQQGDAGEHVLWLCYTAVTDSKSLRLWIESSGEMGGPNNDITEIAVRLVPNGLVPSDCPVLPKRFAKLNFGRRPWLGASEEAVKRTFGVGLVQAGKQYFIGYDGKVSDDGKCEGGYDLMNSMYFTFEAGIVVAIDAGEVTSC